MGVALRSSLIALFGENAPPTAGTRPLESVRREKALRMDLILTWVALEGS